MTSAVFSFTVEGPPVPKQRPRLGQGRVYTPANTVKWERLVNTVCLLRRPADWRCDGAFRVGLRFYVRSTRGDLDNLAKAVLDGMNKIAFADDRQVQGFDELERLVDYERPRVEVTVRRVG